ncbi:MAG: type II toxin-antitoxin system RelE/ParE family toxin [Pseudomonadota bacterium]
MPAVIFTRSAVLDLERVISFLQEKNCHAAREARQRIGNILQILERYPETGRPIQGKTATRVIVTGFGKCGYVLRYRIDHAGNVVILRIWHGKENRQKER